jgi:Glycosyl transferases group 1
MMVELMRALLVTNNQIDRFGHNQLLARELIDAFAALNVDLLQADYVKEPRRVFDALQNPDIAFFMCFNGFGSEIQLAATLNLNQLDSVFDAFGKPVYDVMHDCPAHDWMAHQSGPVPRQRRMLLTDYSYTMMAAELGAKTPRFVYSITYPKHVDSPSKVIRDRSVDILLPIGLAPPEIFSNRYRPTAETGGGVKRFIFEEAAESSISDWSLDPNVEVVNSCRRAGVPFHLGSEADRFLLTCVENYVKFERRRRLLRALSDHPVTVIADREIEKPDSSPMTFIQNLSAHETLMKMGDSKIVICPTPHKNGFHERPMGAFTMGATVVSAPNTILETHFVHDREFVSFRSEADLVKQLDYLLEDETRLEQIAKAGHTRAMSLFPPIRLAETVLSIHSMENPRPAARDALKEAS